MARYLKWKAAHGQPEAALMQCYAPDVRIIREDGHLENYNDLLQLAQEVRKLGSFVRVTDVETPQVIHLTSPQQRIEIRVRQRYDHTNAVYMPCIGERRLIWEKRGEQWLIVEDDFPPSYTPVKPQPAPSSVESPIQWSSPASITH